MISRDAGYLTSGQVAQSLGVSKKTVLRAVETGALRVAYRMPGGALRFLQAEVERYIQRLELQERLRMQTVAPPAQQSGQPNSLSDTLASPPADASSTMPTGAVGRAARASQSVVSGLERPALLPPGGERDARDEHADILTLLADSLQVGASCLARLQDRQIRVSSNATTVRVWGLRKERRCLMVRYTEQGWRMVVPTP